MLKWADETRRKLGSVDSELHVSNTINSSRSSVISSSESNNSSNISSVVTSSFNDGSDGSSSEENSVFLPSVKSAKTPSPVQRRRQKNMQRRRHSSCCQLYAAPEQILLAWDNGNSPAVNGKKQPPIRNSLPTSLSDRSSDSTIATTNNVLKITTKPELLQITTKQGDKNRPSFWKSLIGKRSWPAKTYKSPMRKSQSIIETYKKIDDSCYITPEINQDATKQSSDYGLSTLVISSDSTSNFKSGSHSSQSYHSLKTIRRHSDTRRPKLFNKKPVGRSRSPEGGFSDIRLSMSLTVDPDTDSGVPGSPTLSSSSSNGSTCYRKP